MKSYRENITKIYIDDFKTGFYFEIKSPPFSFEGDYYKQTNGNPIIFTITSTVPADAIVTHR